MSEEKSTTDSRRKVRDLLGRATLLRARGQYDQALTLAREAISLDDTDWEAHELAGDLLMERNQPGEALSNYRRAHELKPGRNILEHKIGRAALAEGEKKRKIEYSEALLEGRVKAEASKRNPSYAALLSLIPGLGQLYNGHLFKCMIVMVLFLALVALTIASIGRDLAGPSGSVYSPSVTPTSFFTVTFSSINIILVLTLAALWIYAIVDAAVSAGKTITNLDDELV